MMEDALQDLPETLEGLYEDQLKQIPKDYKEKARLILMWLAYSLRPLTLRELASAVSIPNPQKVLEVCNSSLVSLQQTGDSSHQFDDTHQNICDSIVKLDHFSVKEYLLSDHLLASESTAYFHANPLVAHLTIAETSVSHIIDTNHVDFWKIRKRRDPIADGDPLLRYSTVWYSHIHEADELSTSSQESKESTPKARSAEAQLDLEFLRTKARRLFCAEFSQSFRNWIYLVQYEVRILPILNHMLVQTSPILIASSLDIVDNVRRLLNDGVSVDGDIKPDVKRVTKPVQVAAIAGSLKVFRLLLDRGAILNQSDLDIVARYNSRHGARVLTTMLLSQQDLAVTDNTMEALASNVYSPEMLDYILGEKDGFTLTHAMSMTLLQSHWTAWGDISLKEKIVRGIWFMIRNSNNILITNSITCCLELNIHHGHVTCSMFMDHGNCTVNEFEGLREFETHMRTCPVGLSNKTIRAAARWEPAAIKYLQVHARSNVKFTKDLPDAEPSSSDT